MSSTHVNAFGRLRHVCSGAQLWRGVKDTRYILRLLTTTDHSRLEVVSMMYALMMDLRNSMDERLRHGEVSVTIALCNS